jgi:VIT1/CCC1 family predicted Fe2+/Mn2+ transporter
MHLQIPTGLIVAAMVAVTALGVLVAVVASLTRRRPGTATRTEIRMSAGRRQLLKLAATLRPS